MRLPELDCRAALLQLADDVPAAVDDVLQRLWKFHERTDADQET